MKHMLNLLLAVFFIFNLQAAESSKSTGDYTFTIHIGAFVKANISDFNNIRQFGYLYSLQLNNLQQIYMGDYETETAANKVLAQVKNAGFMDAFTTRRSIKDGNQVTVIQLGTKAIGEEINWSEFAVAGPLNVLLSGNSVKIMTGSFDDLSIAKQQLSAVKKMGFNDAFMKNVNELLLHKVTSFETGGKVDIPKEFSFTPEPERVVSEKNLSNTIGGGKAKTSNSPANEAIPQSYDVVVLTPKSAPVANEIAKPAIRKNVKRTSVLKLQEVLKAEGTYNGSLDGLYGPGTAKGFDQMMAENREIQKYQILSKTLPSETGVAQQKNIGSGYSLNWEVIRLLETIVNDFNPAPEKIKTTKSAEKNLKQTQLLTATNAPNPTEYANIDAWNESLWKGLNEWENADPLHIRMTTPLKIAYFQSWALLEDYFMDKGFEAKEARGMSLFVLQNIVEPGLSSYRK